MQLEELLYTIIKLNNATKEAFSFKCVDTDDSTLNQSHIKTLMIIRFIDKPNMTNICEKLGLKKGSFTTVAKYLQTSGYISKKMSEDDHRAYYLVLTQKGDDLANQIIANQQQIVSQRLDVLTENEKLAYISALNLVLSTTNKIIENI